MGGTKKVSLSETLVLDASPEAFFCELVQDAIRQQQVRVLPETEFYLVRLLQRFIQAENLFARDQEGTLQDQPLTFLFKEALEAPSSEYQKMLFQNVGDISLYKVGFFQESLNRAAIPVDFYIGIGGNAYLHAAERSEVKHHQELFEDLGKRFETCVDVLLEVSERTTNTKTEQDVLRLYDIWSKTGSERAARALQRVGIRITKNRS